MVYRVSCLFLLLFFAFGEGCTCESKNQAQKDNYPPVVVVDPDELNGLQVEKEKEPNNRRQEAQLLTTERQIEATIRATDTRLGDLDWYRVTIEAEDQILVGQVTGVKELDLLLEAYNEEGKRLMRINNTRLGGGEVLVNLRTVPGTYYLRVRERKGRSSPGRYRIGYKLRPAEEGEEQEPNWKSALATPLPMEEEAVGYFGWHTDNDWYSVELKEIPEGSRIKVELDGVDNVQANLSVRDAKGTLIQERWGASGESIVLSNLALPSLQKIFIVARCRYHYNVESRYSLRVLSYQASGTTEAEPNDRPEKANPLPLRGMSTAGLLGDSKDRDVYRVTVRQGSFVRIQVVPPLGLDVSLSLLNRAGSTVWDVDQTKARGEEVLPVIWVDPARGSMIQVKAQRGKVNLVSPYHISAKIVSGMHWEKEPNNTKEQAMTWTGQQLKGYIHPLKDVDYFRVPSESIQLSVVIPPKMPMQLDVLESSGTVIATSGPSGSRQTIRLKAQTTTGSSLFIKVSSVAEIVTPPREYILNRESP